MCQIEFIAFNVNGLANIPNCIANETDAITIDLGASFASNETGSWRAWVAVSYNNGEEEYYSATKNVSSGINDFIISIPSRTGIIKVTEVSINNPITQCVITENPTMLNCQILTVSAPVNVGSINFVSNPSGAEIILNNSDQQHITPYTITGVQVGTHSYRLTLLNHPDITGNVTVQANQILQVSADFTTGQVNTGLLVGAIVTAVLIGGLVYYMTSKPETASIIAR
jgi:hypothetical protein